MSGRFIAFLMGLKGLGAEFRQVVNRLPPRTKHSNNVWHCANDSDTALVFVHGLYSNSDACWLHASAEAGFVYWPDLVSHDKRFDGAAIFLAGYHTTKEAKSKGYGLKDCAHELMRALRLPDPERRIAVMDKQTVVFVCHSAGGAVVRYMLEVYAEEFATKRVGLLLLASPSYGSKFATLLAMLPWWTDKLAAQLAWGNDILDDLDGRFKALLQSRRIAGLIGREAFEHEPTAIGPMGRVVHRESAARYFPEPAHLPNTDHYSISKPDCIDHPSHRLLVEFFATHFQTAAAQTRQTVSTTPSSAETTKDSRVVLFESYSPACEPYYVSRPVDELVNKSMEMFNLWIWGLSGCGKTCVVRRLASSRRSQYLYVALGHTESNSVPAVLQDIWLTLLQRLKLPPPNTLNLPARTIALAIGDLVAEYCPNHLIHLDEVPIDNTGGLAELCAYIDSIIVVVNEQKPDNRVRFVVSSLSNPPIDTGHGLSERIQVIETPQWDLESLRALVRRVNTSLSLGLDESAIDTIVTASGGSPRPVKKILRSYLTRAERSAAVLASIVDETRRGL